MRCVRCALRACVVRCVHPYVKPIASQPVLCAVWLAYIMRCLGCLRCVRNLLRVPCAAYEMRCMCHALRTQCAARAMRCLRNALRVPCASYAMRCVCHALRTQCASCAMRCVCHAQRTQCAACPMRCMRPACALRYARMRRVCHAPCAPCAACAMLSMRHTHRVLSVNEVLRGAPLEIVAGNPDKNPFVIAFSRENLLGRSHYLFCQFFRFQIISSSSVPRRF